MNYIKTLEKQFGVDVGYHDSVVNPVDNVGCVGKLGINKHFSLEQVVKLAHGVQANIIIKAGQNAKWYLKKIDIMEIDTLIEKQKWRDTSKCIMWIIEWDE